MSNKIDADLEITIRHMVADEMGVGPDDVRMSDTLEMTGLDSLDVIDLIIDVEKKFEINIDEMDVTGDLTVERFAAHVRLLIGRAA